METFLSRYRNISVLLLLLAGQLLLLAYQVKSGQDVRLIRVWAVTAVAPLANVSEWVRERGARFGEMFAVRGLREENKRLKSELGQIKVQNNLLKAEISTADRAKALSIYAQTSPSKLLAARVIFLGTGANSRTVFVDRGSRDGVMKGMAVITPDGIAGRVTAAYPTASLVSLVTSQGFAAGVISQKHKVRGTMKGVGSSLCPVDHIENRDTVEVGEWLYTSGDDRIFPKGLPAGIVRSAREGRGGKDVVAEPVGLRSGVDEVLIVIGGVHGLIPDPLPPSSPGVQILEPPPAEPGSVPVEEPATGGGVVRTDADRLMDRYRRIGESQGHSFGAAPGRVPDFNRAPAPPKPAPTTAQPEAGTDAQPAAPVKKQ
ncbi:MAG TPA: rod shape-determining protein MreC [Bryobacteraceae bacterium]|nr:rod shape-determining protein MreC [Bryobacteraceae bacterium]